MKKKVIRSLSIITIVIFGLVAAQFLYFKSHSNYKEQIETYSRYYREDDIKIVNIKTFPVMK